MALELQRDHHAGVVSNAMYDYYWPGYEDSAPLGHNTVCLLTEVGERERRDADRRPRGRSARGPEGAARLQAADQFPRSVARRPWTLRDIVDYDLSAVHGLLQAVSAYREQIVQNFYDMGRRAVEAGKRGGPFAFIIPPEQHDPHAAAKLEELLLRGSIEIHRALEPFRADGDPYPAGTDVILLAQPYRAYVKTLLERQNYPARRETAGAPPERPYDVAGWTLPLQMGVDVRTIERTFEPPAMSRVDGADDRAGQRVGRNASPATTSSMRAAMAARSPPTGCSRRALKPSWTTTGDRSRRLFHYDPGSIVVPYSKPGERLSRASRRTSAFAPTASKARCRRRRGRLERRARGALQAVGREHRRRVDALGARAVRVPVHVDRRRRHPRRQPAREVRRDHPAERAGPTADRRDIRPAPCRRNTPAGSATSGIAALKKFVEAGGTLIALDESAGLRDGDVRSAAARCGALEPGRSFLLPRLNPAARRRPVAAARLRHERAHGGVLRVQFGVRHDRHAADNGRPRRTLRPGARQLRRSRATRRRTCCSADGSTARA